MPTHSPEAQFRTFHRHALLKDFANRFCEVFKRFLLLSATSSRNMGKHLNPKEIQLIETKAKTKGVKAKDVIKLITKLRQKKNLPPPSETAVRRILRGETYQRGRVDRRGRQTVFGTQLKKTVDKVRRKLLKKADNQHRVTWDLIMQEAKLKGKVSDRTVRKHMNKAGRKWRPARAKIDRSKDNTVLMCALGRICLLHIYSLV